MAQFVTRETLRAFAADLQPSERTRILTTASTRSLTGSTFLSHSSKDQDLVVGATLVLQNHGAQVYVDEIDPEMPPYTSDETADLLKSRIKQTKRFVLLTSKNSKDSRWVPWELGIADGYKGLPRIALFPSADSPYDTNWASWEYLGLYHQIAWGRLEGYSDEVWMVLDHKRNTAVELRAWLTGP